MNDLVMAALVGLVAALVQAAKQPLPEGIRDRWTALLAIVLGVATVAVYQLTIPDAGWTSATCASVALRGATTGLAAVGLWKTQDDVREGGTKP